MRGTVIQTGTVGSAAKAHSPDPERRNRDSSSANTGAVSINGATSDDEKKRKAFDPVEMFTKDWRNYRCKTWHLEPTVR
jgi:hypothetical protein